MFRVPDSYYDPPEPPEWQQSRCCHCGRFVRDEAQHRIERNSGIGYEIYYLTCSLGHQTIIESWPIEPPEEERL